MVKSKVRNTLDLIKTCAKGDDEALMTLFSLYWPRIHHAVRLRLGVDLRRLYHTKEVPFLALGRAIKSFPLIKWQGEGSFLGWLYYVTIGLVRSEKAGSDPKQAIPKQETPGQADSEPADPGKSASSMSFSRWNETLSFHQKMKELEKVRAVMEGRPREHMTLLDLRLFLKMSLEELGEFFGVSPEEASKKLRKAIAAFAEACVEPREGNRNVRHRFLFQDFLKKWEEGGIGDPESFFESVETGKEKLLEMWKTWQRVEKTAGWRV